MLRIKFLTSIIIFSSLLIATSIIKNKTRDIEKKIYQLNKIIHLKKNDFNESQLDYFYLTSPAIIEKKIENLDNNLYSPVSWFTRLNAYATISNISLQRWNCCEFIFS